MNNFPVHINTYNGGMDKDTSVNKYDNTHYQHAENFRIITEDGLTSGALKTVSGTEESFIFPTNYYYYGHTFIRDYIVLLLRHTGSEDKIYYFPIEGYTKVSFFIDPAYCVYTGDLNFQSDRIAQIEGRYESANTQKIYWIDGVNNIRFMNLMESDLSSKSSKYFDILSEFNQTPISITSITNDGALTAGLIQYTTLFYTVKGSETVFSQPTPLIQLTLGDLTGDWLDIEGLNSGVNSNKAVTLTITNPDPDLFTRVRVMSIHYLEQEASPKITIIGEFSIVNTLVVRDGGSNYEGEYSIEEFNRLKNIFAAETLATKNNFLFAGNIEEKYTEVDYDARAYRFNATTSSSIAFSDFYTIYAEGIVFNKKLVFASTDQHNGAGATFDDYWYYTANTIYIMAPINLSIGATIFSDFEGTFSASVFGDICSVVAGVVTFTIPIHSVGDIMEQTTTTAPGGWDFSGSIAGVSAKLTGAVDYIVDDIAIAGDADHWGVTTSHDAVNPYTNLLSDNQALEGDATYDYRYQNNNFLTTWNDSTDTYDTFTLATDPTGVTSAINAAGAAVALSNDISLTKGDVVTFKSSLTLNSGELPTLSLLLGAEVKDSTAFTAGANIVSFLIDETGTYNLKLSNTAASNYTLGTSILVMLGGSGPNISYKFTVDTFAEDEAVEANNYGYLVDGVSTVAGLLVQRYEGPTTSLDPDLQSTKDNYLSPFRRIKSLSFRRDEIYRVGIEWFDTYGRPIFVDWIGDIRFPSNRDSGYEFVSVDFTAGHIYMHPITLTVSVTITQDLLDNEVAGFRIVRCERTSQDKTVLDSGLVGSLRDHTDGSVGGYIFPKELIAGQLGQVTGGTGVPTELTYADPGTLSDTLKEYVSPEIDYNKENVSLNGTYLMPDFNLDAYFSFVGLDYHAGYDPYVEATLIYKKYSILDNTTYDNTLGFNITDTILFSDTNYDASNGTPAYYKSLGTDVIHNYSQGGMSKNQNDEAIGTCLILKGTLDAGADNPYKVSKLKQAIYSARKRNIIPYGGNTYANRLNSEYVGCSPYYDISASVLNDVITAVATGDTYLFMHEHLRTMISQLNTNAGNSSNLEVLLFPTESSYNGTLREGYPIYKAYPMESPDLVNIHETTGVYTNTIDTTPYMQTFNYYDYNKLYNGEELAKKFVPAPLDFYEINTQTYDNKVVASEKKFNNEYIDSWTEFYFANEIELDTKYGSLTKLINLNNNLVAFQERGISQLAVEEKEVVQTGTPTSLAIGYSGVLSRYDYLSTDNGTTMITGIVQTPGQILWYDDINNGIYSLKTLGEPSISKIKGMSSWFNSKIIDSAVSGYDRKFNEVLFNFVDEDDEVYTLVYNDLTNSFTSFYTLPELSNFISYGNKFFGVSTDGSVNEHNISTTSALYSAAITAKLTLIVKPQVLGPCRFDTMEWESIATTLSTGVEETESAFITNLDIRNYNSYQDSGLISSPDLRRHFRTWKYNTIRDYVNSTRARLRDTYMAVDLEYETSGIRSLLVNDMRIHYLPNRS